MKKSIKRVLISMLIVLLVVLFQGQSFAATNSLTLALTPDKTELKAGETVVVLVNVSNIQGEGIIAFNANVNYDANIFECTAEGDESGAWEKQGFIANNLTTTRADVLANSENQTVAKLTFKAKADATVGEQTISLSLIEFSTENEAYNVDDVQVKVQIITESTPGGDDDNQEPTPGGNENCEHTYEKYTQNPDQLGHSAVCTKCGQEHSEEHTYGEYTTNKEGLHYQTCSKCGYSKEEKHSYENGKCVECGAVQDSAKKDPTTSDKEFSKAGLNNFVVMAIGVAVVVTVVCFYQYKNI